jgi:hypothetical protein
MSVLRRAAETPNFDSESIREQASKVQRNTNEEPVGGHVFGGI